MGSRMGLNCFPINYNHLYVILKLSVTNLFSLISDTINHFLWSAVLSCRLPFPCTFGMKHLWTLSSFLHCSVCVSLSIKHGWSTALLTCGAIDRTTRPSILERISLLYWGLLEKDSIITTTHSPTIMRLVNTALSIISPLHSLIWWHGWVWPTIWKQWRKKSYQRANLEPVIKVYLLNRRQNLWKKIKLL